MPRAEEQVVEPVRAEDHLGLARWQAMKFLGRVGRKLRRGERLEDTDEYADGLVGLMEAVKRFDPSRGVKFSTYAIWWVRREIGDGQYRRGQVLRAGLRPRNRETLFGALSIDGDKEQRFFEELLAAPVEEVQTEVESQFDRLWRLLEFAKGRDRRILFKRAMGMNLQEIGLEEEPPITRERVRQLEGKALERLRRELRRRGITRDGDSKDSRKPA